MKTVILFLALFYFVSLYGNAESTKVSTPILRRSIDECANHFPVLVEMEIGTFGKEATEIPVRKAKVVSPSLPRKSYGLSFVQDEMKKWCPELKHIKVNVGDWTNISMLNGRKILAFFNCSADIFNSTFCAVPYSNEELQRGLEIHRDQVQRFQASEKAADIEKKRQLDVLKENMKDYQTVCQFFGGALSRREGQCEIPTSISRTVQSPEIECQKTGGTWQRCGSNTSNLGKCLLGMPPGSSRVGLAACIPYCECKAGMCWANGTCIESPIWHGKFKQKNS